MKSDIVYALAAMVCYGVGDFVYKRAAATGVAAEQFLMGQGWVFCPTTIGWLCMGHRKAPCHAVCWIGRPCRPLPVDRLLQLCREPEIRLGQRDRAGIPAQLHRHRGA